jgi:hypothetical protein
MKLSSRGPHQMAFAQRDPPGLIRRRVTGLGAGDMTAAAGALVIGVLGLDELQADARFTQVTQIEHEVGLVAGAGRLVLEVAAATRAVRRMMRAHLGDGKRLGAAMAGGAGALSGALGGPVFSGRARCRIAGGRLRGVGGLCSRIAIVVCAGGARLGARRLRGGVARRLISGVAAMTAAPLPGRLATRRARAVVRGLIKALVGELQIGEQLL